MVLKLFRKHFLTTKSLLVKPITPVDMNEYGEFQDYGTIDEGEYGTIEESPSTSSNISQPSVSLSLSSLDDSLLLALFRRIPAEDVNNLRLVNRRCNKVIKDNSIFLLPRLVDYVIIHRRGDGIVKLSTIGKGGEMKECLVQVVHLCHYLNRVHIKRLDVTGKLCTIMVQALREVQIDMLCVKNAKVTARPSDFSECLRFSCVRSLVLSQCHFEDAQFVSDEMFLENPQITKIKITCSENHWQSFPLLTNRLLSDFSSRCLPTHFTLHNVESSFTIDGLLDMIETARSCPLNTSYHWSFGRILSYSSDCRQRLQNIDDVIVMRVHKTQICVHAMFSSFVQAHFFTRKIRRENGFESSQYLEYPPIL